MYPAHLADLVYISCCGGVKFITNVVSEVSGTLFRFRHVYVFSNAPEVNVDKQLSAGYTPHLVFPSYSLLKSLTLSS